MGRLPWIDVRLRNMFAPRTPQDWQPLALDDLPESTAEVYRALKARMARR